MPQLGSLLVFALFYYGQCIRHSKKKLDEFFEAARLYVDPLKFPLTCHVASICHPQQHHLVEQSGHWLTGRTCLSGGRHNTATYDIVKLECIF